MTETAIPTAETHTEDPPKRTRARREAQVSRLLLVGFTASVLVGWQIASNYFPPLILPAPIDVAIRLVDFITSGRAWPHILTTATEVFLGFGLGALVGVTGGVLAAEFSLAKRIIMPYVIVSQAIPKFALAPLLIIWLGFGIAPKVVIAALISFFPLLENTFLGLTSTDAKKLELFRALRASRWQTLKKLKWPNAVPAIFSGMRVALVLSLVGAVVAEYVGADQGLGALIIVAQGILDVELMFVAIMIITAFGLLLDFSHKLLYRFVLGRLYGKADVAAAADGGSRIAV